MAKRERVYGVVDYYDGVLDGVADYQGRPHAFVLDGDADSLLPIYRLSPLSFETMTLFQEAWDIWRRWELAQAVSSANVGVVAALPEDRARHDELASLLTAQLSVPAEATLRARGAFARSPGSDPAQDGLWAMEVEWSDV